MQREEEASRVNAAVSDETQALFDALAKTYGLIVIVPSQSIHP
jgi:hypothetical protein